MHMYAYVLRTPHKGIFTPQKHDGEGVEFFFYFFFAQINEISNRGLEIAIT